MREMFSDCYKLIYIDLSSFNAKNLTNIKFMFSGSYNLKKIKDNLKTDIEIIYVWSHIAKTIILIIINYKKIFIYF